MNSVCAGTIETPISADERKAHGWTYDQWEKLKVQDVMLGRVGNTREIANATLFFACHESSYCTATHLMVVSRSVGRLRHSTAASGAQQLHALTLTHNQHTLSLSHTHTLTGWRPDALHCDGVEGPLLLVVDSWSVGR